MDPLVLMKNLDHVRMTSRRLSYILQQQVHLYTPEANQLREQIDRYVEAERQIEGEMARRQHPRLKRGSRTNESLARSGVRARLLGMSAMPVSGPGGHGGEAARGGSLRGPGRRPTVRMPASTIGSSNGAASDETSAATSSATGAMTTVIGRRAACSSTTIRVESAASAGMSKRLKPIPWAGEVVRHEASKQAARGDGAHLVIELRPAHASAAVAETDELDRVRVRDSRGGGT